MLVVAQCILLHEIKMKHSSGNEFENLISCIIGEIDYFEN
jgi:hypothetical protein